MRILSTAQRIAVVVAAVFYVVAGALHFIKPAPYLRIMPPYIPSHAAMVRVSGAFEILGGIGLLVPRLTVPAAWGLIALLVAVFPANVHMALHPELFPTVPPWTLWARLPLQPALIGWAWLYTRSKQEERRGG